MPFIQSMVGSQLFYKKLCIFLLLKLCVLFFYYSWKNSHFIHSFDLRVVFSRCCTKNSFFSCSINISQKYVLNSLIDFAQEKKYCTFASTEFKILGLREKSLLAGKLRVRWGLGFGFNWRIFLRFGFFLNCVFFYLELFVVRLFFTIVNFWTYFNG